MLHSLYPRLLPLLLAALARSPLGADDTLAGAVRSEDRRAGNEVLARSLTRGLPYDQEETVIDANGVITWTPTEAQGPGTNVFETVVTDNGVPALSATNSFTVTVLETNTAPVLGVVSNQTVVELSTDRKSVV